jgi:hypothetical protein
MPPERRAELADIFRHEVARIGGIMGQLWLAAESAGVRARDAHRFLEWDGWEEGLLYNVIGPPDPNEDADPSDLYGMSSAIGSSMKKGVGGTFRMRNGFVGLSLA